MASPQLIWRVGISGSYGGLKLGDEAILESIVSQLRASGSVEIIVFSRDEVTADPAVLLEPAPLPPGALQSEGLNEKRRLIGLSVREPGAAAPDIDELEELPTRTRRPGTCL